MLLTRSTRQSQSNQFARVSIKHNRNLLDSWFNFSQLPLLTFGDRFRNRATAVTENELDRKKCFCVFCNRTQVHWFWHRLRVLVISKICNFSCYNWLSIDNALIWSWSNFLPIWRKMTMIDSYFSGIKSLFLLELVYNKWKFLFVTEFKTVALLAHF